MTSATALGLDAIGVVTFLAIWTHPIGRVRVPANVVFQHLSVRPAADMMRALAALVSTASALIALTPDGISQVASSHSNQARSC